MVLPEENSRTVLTARELSKKFCRKLSFSMGYGLRDLFVSAWGFIPNTARLRRFEFWALNDIRLNLDKGQILGVIGRNGCGKTTLLRVLAGIFPPDRGEICIKGRLATLITAGAGFHPAMAVRENIFLNGAILGLSRAEIVARMGRILHLSGLQDSLEVPLGTLSSGMQVRLGFAVAAAAEPQVLLLDEILSFGDRAFGEQCMETIKQISQRAGILIVSHNLEFIQQICTDVIVMEQGRIVFSSADVEAGVEHYNEMVSVDKSLK